MNTIIDQNLAAIEKALRWATNVPEAEQLQFKKELIDIKYDALTISSELTEKSRQSRIEEYISAEGNTLETATTPPYLIRKKK